MDSPRQHQQYRCQQDCRNKKPPIPAINWWVSAIDRRPPAQIIEHVTNGEHHQHTDTDEHQSAKEPERQTKLFI